MDSNTAPESFQEVFQATWLKMDSSTAPESFQDLIQATELMMASSRQASWELPGSVSGRLAQKHFQQTS